jgi:hypothetical protein
LIGTFQLRIPRRQVDRLDLLEGLIAERCEGRVLRWAVVACTPDAFDCEYTAVAPELGLLDPAPVRAEPHGLACVVNLVPTGIGCSIGGFAGDAAPATRLLASCCDLLLTNPNAVNASDFVSVPENLVYVEGSLLDLFCAGAAELAVPRANRIGIVLDPCPDEDLARVLDVINAVSAVHGVDVLGYVVADEPVNARSVRMPSGSFAGALDDPSGLVYACERLVAEGATAIAVASTIRDLEPETYELHFGGGAPNPVGGAEAVVSHLVCRRFGLPAAHAPLRNFTATSRAPYAVDPRAGGEAASFSGLASVLIGLQRAPQLAGSAQAPRAVVSLADVLAVVAPATALGGAPVLHAAARGIPVIAVRENETILDVSAEALPLTDVIVARSYAEAAGQLVALRDGIALRTTTRPLPPVPRLDDPLGAFVTSIDDGRPSAAEIHPVAPAPAGPWNAA